MFSLSLVLLVAARPSIRVHAERAHVERAEAVVARLAPEIGSPLRISAKLANAFVYLERHGAAAETALAALADALHASVTTGPEGRLLERTPEDTKRFEAARAAERAGWIQTRRDGVAEYRRATLKEGNPQSAILAEVARAGRVSEEISRGRRASPEAFFATELLPAERLLEALVDAIGPERLASVPDGRMWVWEDDPVAGARPLPPYGAAFGAYEAEIARLKGSPIPDSARAQIANLGMAPFFADWTSENPPPRRLRLAVRAEGAMLTLLLTGYDATGRQALTAAMIGQPAKVWRMPNLIVADALRKPDAEWVALSPESVEAVEISPDALVTKPPVWYTDPVLHEPLDLFVAETFAGLAAREGGRCFAAQVDDSVWADARTCIVGGRVNLDALRELYRETGRYERIETGRAETGGWVAWRPKNDIEPTEIHGDRRAMRAFARTVLRTKSLDLRTVAGYRAAVGPRMTPLTSLWERPEGARAIRAFSGGASHTLYRVLGTLTGEGWRRLESGETATVESLGVGARFGEWLDEDRITVQAPSEAQGGVPDIFRHPRELFPRGEIGGARLGMSVRRTAVYGVQDPRGGGAVQWGTVTPRPESFRIVNDPDLGPETRARFEKAFGERRYGLGTRDERTVTVTFPRGITHRVTFFEPAAPTTPLGAYADLPIEARDEIWRQFRESIRR